VLVSGVMSVFLGDEIDGSMDSFRAEETALTLRNLVNTVSQILVVSHKNPEADHKIILGNHASES
jgi:DNA repair exonuclease SbcCD ATPase subunit